MNRPDTAPEDQTWQALADTIKARLEAATGEEIPPLVFGDFNPAEHIRTIGAN